MRCWWSPSHAKTCLAARLENLLDCARSLKLVMLMLGAGETSQDELAGFTPAFLWLLRDFYLSLEEDADGQVGLHACSWHSVLWPQLGS